MGSREPARVRVRRSLTRRRTGIPAPDPRLREALDELYAGFNAPDSALDPVQIVRRYPRVEDRELVAFVAAALAFGRVQSVMASVEALCRVLGPEPAAFVRAFDPARHGAPLAGLVHRWTRGNDFVALVWILRQMIERHGSLERAITTQGDPAAPHYGPAIEAFSTEARAVDLAHIYGRRTPAPGVAYFFSRPSSGGACKRVNLFLRWMIRRDAVDPGGWTSAATRRLIVPLDTHTIRVGRCLRLTRRASPGWKMAEDITASLRLLDPDDPVRYDFSLCHLSMMGACGWGASRGSAACPLHLICRPRRPVRAFRS